MPSPRVWSSRRPLYKATLVVLIAVAPLNLLSLVLPYWLETKAVMTRKIGDRNSMTNVPLTYGIWVLCSDSLGCRDVHDSSFSMDVGAWLYVIKLFMVVSVLCHLFAVVCGSLQNFLPREYIRRWRGALWRRVVHRDCPYTEDIGFIAGFLGHVSCIIFMVGTKDQMSNGAQYQWAFAFAFISSSLTVVATLALTKTHIMTTPRPAQTRRNGFQPSQPSADSAREVLPSWNPGAEVRPEDIHLRERGGQAGAAQAEGRSRRNEGGSDRSSSRRRRSRSRSRSRERRSSSRSRRHHSGLFQSRLVRSRELENIPAAVAPSTSESVPTVATGPYAHGSRKSPIMCVEMSDFQSRTASLPEMGAGRSINGSVPSTSSTRRDSCDQPQAGSSSDQRAESSCRKGTTSQGVEFHRTQSEAAVVLPPGTSLQDADSSVVRGRKSKRDRPSGSDVQETVRL